jgi:hypothetical protein
MFSGDSFAWELASTRTTTKDHFIWIAHGASLRKNVVPGAETNPVFVRLV